MTKYVYYKISASGPTEVTKGVFDIVGNDPNIVQDGITFPVSTKDWVISPDTVSAPSNKIIYNVYNLSVSEESYTKPDDYSTATYSEQDETTTHNIRAWGVIAVPDDYVIPYGLDHTGLTSEFHFSTPDKVAIETDLGSFDVDKNTFQSLSWDTVKTDLVNSAGAAAEYGFNKLGFSGLATAIHNVNAVGTSVSTIIRNGGDVALHGIEQAGQPNADYGAFDAYLSSVRGTAQSGLDGVTIVPGNAAADSAAHTVLNDFTIVGAGGQLAGASLTLQLTADFGGGISLSTSAGVSAGIIISGDQNATIEGLSANNILIGGDGSNTIYAGPGHDYVNGEGGNDTIYAGTGRDYIDGGGGNDVIYAASGGGVGTIDGGAGADTVVFQNSLASYQGGESAGGYSIGQGGATYSLINDETLKFSDGHVDLGRSTALFDPLFYDDTYGDVYAAGVNPSQHYDAYGWKEGRNPDPFFSTTGYESAYHDVKLAGVNPLLHYDTYGWKEGRDPSADFDTTLYLLHNPDVAASGMDPLVHYLEYGRYEGRMTYKAIGKAITADGFDAEYYLLSNPDVAAAGVDPYQHFLTYGWKEGRNPNAYFDTKYYLAHNPDVAAAGVDPLLEYDQTGWKEGRNPSANFNTNAYLAQNKDVAAAGIDPLTHFLAYGADEGRSALPVLPMNGSYTGLIAGLGNVTSFAESLSAGQRYSFQVSGLPIYTLDESNPFSPLLPSISVTDVNGNVVANLGNHSGLTVGFTAPTTGTYFFNLITPSNLGASTISAAIYDPAHLSISANYSTLSEVKSNPTNLSFLFDGTRDVFHNSLGANDHAYVEFTLLDETQLQVDLTGITQSVDFRLWDLTTNQLVADNFPGAGGSTHWLLTMAPHQYMIELDSHSVATHYDLAIYT